MRVIVYYLGWNRSPAQIGCMRQVLGPGALGRPRGIRWRGRWEGGSGRGTHVNPWLIHVNVWQNPLQHCKVISLQLIKINEKKKTHTAKAEQSLCSFFASQQKNSGWYLFFSSLALGCSRNRTMDSNDSFLNSVGKTKDELLSWSPWQLLLFNASYTNLDILPFQTYLPNGTPLSDFFHT